MTRIFFEALANSIKSIRTILELGHITDAKALLRNLFDEIIVNLYLIARLKKKDDDFLNQMGNDDFLAQGLQLEKLCDDKVSDWLLNNKTKQLKKALRYEDMRDYLQAEVRVAGIVGYLESSECKKMREWLNDAVHLNYYKAVLLNDGRLCIDNLRRSALDKLKHTFDHITMFHISCVFCLEPVYLMSSDYMDYKGCGMEPPEGCQYDVAPFIQAYLDATVYKTFPDWAEKLVEVASPMRLSKLESANGSDN